MPNGTLIIWNLMTNLSLFLPNYNKRSFCYKTLQSRTKAREVLEKSFFCHVEHCTELRGFKQNVSWCFTLKLSVLFLSSAESYEIDTQLGEVLHAPTNAKNGPDTTCIYVTKSSALISSFPFGEKHRGGLRLTHFNAAPSILLLAFGAAGTSTALPYKPGQWMNRNMTWLSIASLREDCGPSFQVLSPWIFSFLSQIKITCYKDSGRSRCADVPK